MNRLKFLGVLFSFLKAQESRIVENSSAGQWEGWDWLGLSQRLRALYLNCCRETFPEPSRFILQEHCLPQGTARHVRIRTGLPPEAASIPSPALSPFCSQVKKSATPPWFGKIQCFSNAAVGSTNHVWQCFMHFPNVTVQNLRLCSPTKFCLW